MDQKINTVQNQLKKSLDRDLKINLELSFKGDLGFLTTEDSQIAILIVMPDDIEQAVQEYPIIPGDKKLVVVVGSHDKNIQTKLNEKEIAILFAYELDHGSYTGFMSNYFIISSEGFPTFNEVKEKAAQECINKPNHYSIKASNVWAKYRNYNYALPIWSEQDIEKSNWEIGVFNSVLKSAKKAYGSSSSFDGKTFAPISTYKLEDGTEVHNPDFEKMKAEDGLDEYIFSRYQETDFVLFKRRYLEFLLFINSSQIEKPGVFSELLSLLELEIDFIKTNKDKITHHDLHISDLTQRYFELLAFYRAPLESNQENFKDKIEYINSYIDDLFSKKSFRWIIDVPRHILTYPKIKDLFKDRFQELINQLEAGAEFYKLHKNTSLQEACIEEISRLKKELNESFDENSKLAEVKLQHALQLSSQGSYLGGITLLEEAITLQKEAKIKDETKLNELIELHKKWAVLAPKEMKRYEAKIEIPKDQIDAERNQYISILSDIPEKEQRAIVFFSDTGVMIQEDHFLEIYNKTKGSISSFIPTTVIGEIGTTKRPTSEDDQEEIKEFQWYGTIIDIYLDKVLHLFDRCFKEGLFDFDDVIKVIEKKSALSPDGQEFLKEGIKLFKEERYAASIHILTPMIERFFRIIHEPTDKDIKHKARGVEYNVSLDDMIKQSIDLGFPANISRFFRYFYTRSDGFNLRNNLAHSLGDYSFFNNKNVATLVIWSIFFCYINLDPISSD